MSAIRSMTAFARQEQQAALASYTWEIKSVNHRYLDVHFRLPEKLRQLEPELRNRLRNCLIRGKVEVSLRVDEQSSAGNSLEIDEALLRQLIEASEKIEHILGAAKPLSAADLLRWPGLLNPVKLDIDDLEAEAFNSFDALLQHFIENREREGAAMAQVLLQRLEKIDDFIAIFRKHLPETIRNHREKLLARLEQILEKNSERIDPERIEQEVVLFAQKIDIEEELDRLEAHCQEVKRILQAGGSVGRQLDFLMQELNREANTTGSKSASAEQSQAVVDLKVCIEQMREQIQNIE